jgi:hypothetical protein
MPRKTHVSLSRIGFGLPRFGQLILSRATHHLMEGLQDHSTLSRGPTYIRSVMPIRQLTLFFSHKELYSLSIIINFPHSYPPPPQSVIRFKMGRSQLPWELPRRRKETYEAQLFQCGDSTKKGNKSYLNDLFIEGDGEGVLSGKCDTRRTWQQATRKITQKETS